MCQGDQIVGIVTDRDIVVRGVAQGCAPDSTKLEDVMSTDVRCCRENQSLEEVLEEMRGVQVRRMPVVDDEGHVVGILSLGDVAVKAGEECAGEALADISEPAEPDRSNMMSQASGAAGGGSASGQASRMH